MADVQSQFEQFHEIIRIDFEMGEELRGKRDRVVDRIKNYLRSIGMTQPRLLLQGSYIMKTGVKPIADLEYDIDIGLRFDVHEEDYSASTVRSWVYEAVKNHTQRIEDKGPCIRVVYQKGYHLDLVSYAVWEQEEKEEFRLAHKTKGWRPADPPGLLEYVKNGRQRFADTEDAATKTDQFRRCIRCLRRWNDVCFPFEHPIKPCGLALVLLGIQRSLNKTLFLDGHSDDRRALESFTRSLAQTDGRLVASKPTPEYEDLFASLSDVEMDALKYRFGELADALQAAGEQIDPVAACEKLQDVFGDDFPIPAPEETAHRTQAPAIVTSSSSA